jgi:replicative DNA helicase
LNRPDIVERLRDELQEKTMVFDGTVTQPLFERILDCVGRSEPLEYSTLAPSFQDRKELLDILERCFMVEVTRDTEVVYEDAKGCLASLEARRLERELRLLQRDIELAQQQHNFELSLQLSMRKRELSNLLMKNMAQARSKG